MTDTTHEAPDLLPCPFCGGYAKRHEAERDALEAKLALAVALLGQWRLASAGHVSLRSVIDKHDATLAELTGDTP
jgi:hypothetical protein